MMKQSIARYRFLCSLLVLSIIVPSFSYALSSLTRNDYYPLYTTQEPQQYLYAQTKAILNGREPETSKWIDNFNICFTPFGQNADEGRAFDNTEDDSGNPTYQALGSLNAKWSLVGLLLGSAPDDKTLTPKLQTAQDTIFGAVYDDAKIIDSTEELGFFYFPAEYRKRGIRFQLTGRIIEEIGLMIQAGFSDINFNVKSFSYNKDASAVSCASEYTNYTSGNVNTYLNCEFENIAKELELDLTDFHKSGIEDIRLMLFWRNAFEVNENEADWPKLLFIPFLELGGSVALGKEKDPLRAFGLPFGNNGHCSAGGTVGINLDFADTIEIGAEIGGTHFFKKRFDNYPTPTSTLQSGIFPFKTTVEIDPGFNWHFGLKLNAHHFMDKLSFYFQWVIAEHKYDTITVCNNDSAFKPEALEKKSGWKTQVINTALNYDVSPNIGLGFAWQAPVSQRNVFKSTSILFGLNLSF